MASWRRSLRAAVDAARWLRFVAEIEGGRSREWKLQLGRLIVVLILGLIVLAIYVVIRLMTNFSAWITGARYRAYRQLAARYRGRYETRGLSDPPTVSFIHNGATVRVGLAPTIQGQPGQIPRTRVVARFGQGIPFRMELAPAARPAPPQSPRATRPVTTGDREFDNGYVVRANDVEMSRDFLNSTDSLDG